jgi:hypothetical protein
MTKLINLVGKQFGRWSVVAYAGRHTNPCGGYDNYGGRGIGIDEPDWLGFQGYYADVGDREHDGLSLDRSNNDKGYGPANYRWATRSEQRRNQRPRKRKKHRHADITDIQMFANSLARAASASTQGEQQ